MQISTQIKGLKQLQKFLSVEGKRQKKALNLAIKVEAIRQLRELRDQIKKGVPGGHPYAAQLSEIARRTKTGRPKKNQVPLYRLARLLRYNAVYKDGDLQMTFGFVGRRNKKLSGTWKELLVKHEEGIDVLYTGSRSELGERFANIGARLEKKGDPDARFFFLRRSFGRRIRTPKRPMIDPFWIASGGSARKNIVRNFQRKLAGHRI